MTGLDRHSVAGFMRGVGLGEDAHRRDISVAGVPVRFTANDEGLFASYAARFLPSEGGTPAIHLSARIEPELPGWSDERCAPRTFHSILGESGIRAAYPYRPGVWQFMSPETGSGFQLVRTAADLPPWDGGAPLRQHLHWILEQHRMRLVHAACLGEDGEGVLIVGNSGAGKSGLTLAGLSVGLRTVGDDYVALSADGEVAARPLYRIIKQDRFGLSQVPQLAEASGDIQLNWKGKAELDPDAYFPGAFVPKLSIGAVIVPRIARVETPRLVQATAAAAMLSLIRSNLHQYPGEAEDGMSFFADVLRRVPVFVLELSENFQRNGEAVRGLIRSMRG